MDPVLVQVTAVCGRGAVSSGSPFVESVFRTVCGTVFVGKDGGYCRGVRRGKVGLAGLEGVYLVIFEVMEDLRIEGRRMGREWCGWFMGRPISGVMLVWVGMVTLEGLGCW